MSRHQGNLIFLFSNPTFKTLRLSALSFASNQLWFASVTTSTGEHGSTRNGDRSYRPPNDCAVKSQGRQFISACCSLCFFHTALLAAPWIMLIYRTDTLLWLRIWVCQCVLPFSYTKETLKSYMSSRGACAETYLWKNCFSSHLRMWFRSIWNGSSPFYTALVSPSHPAPHKTQDMIFVKGGERFWLRWWTVETYSQYLSVFHKLGMTFSKRATFKWLLCWTRFSVECKCCFCC